MCTFVHLCFCQCGCVVYLCSLASFLFFFHANMSHSCKTNSQAHMHRRTNAHQHISVHLRSALHAGSLFEIRSHRDLITLWSRVLAASENSLTLAHGRAFTRINTRAFASALSTLHTRNAQTHKLSVSAHQVEVFTDERTDAGEVRVAGVVRILMQYIHTKKKTYRQNVF